MSTDFSENVPPPKPLSPARRDDEQGPDLRALKREDTSDDRTIGMIAHFSGLLTWFIVPLILYVVQQNKRSLAAWHAREALNFQLTWTIYALLPAPLYCLMFVAISQDLPWLAIIAIGAPTVLYCFILLYELVIVVWASIAAYRGQYFRIPLNISFIRRPPRPQSSLDMDEYANLD
jgi:uncharacterized Tic20 family protein